MEIRINVSKEVLEKIEASYNEMDDSLWLSIKYGTPQQKNKCWIDEDGKSAVCPFCNKNNLFYGDYCKWCGEKVEVVR